MNREIAGFESTDKIIGTAKMFAGLDPTTIWALLAISLFAYVVWKTKQEIKSDEAWRGVQERRLQGDAVDAELLRRLTEEVLAMKLMITKFLIKE